jgi:PAS domain S-box-containing protein
MTVPIGYEPPLMLTEFPRRLAARSTVFRFGCAAAIAVAVVATRRVAGLWQVDGTLVTPFYPAAGLVVGLGLWFRSERRMLWLLLVAAAVGTIGDALALPNVPIRNALVDGAINTVQAIVIIAGISLVDRRWAVPGPRRSITYGVVVIGGCALGAAFATFGFVGVNEPANFFWQWLMGDALSIAIVSPLLFMTVTPWPDRARGRWLWVEYAASMVFVGVASLLLLQSESIYLALPVAVVVWAAARFGPRGAFPAALIVTGIASALAVQADSPLVVNVMTAPLDLHLLMGAVVAAAHLAAAQAERSIVMSGQLVTANRARDRAEVRVRQLGESAFAGVLQLNEHFRIDYSNEAFALMLGRRVGEIIGRSAQDFIDPVQWERAAPLRAALVEQRSVQADVHFVHANGEPAVLFGTMRGLFDDVAHSTVITAVFIDVTQQRESDRMQRDLSDRVARAEDDERRRLARTLHDGPIQELVAVDLRLGALRRSLRNDAGAQTDIRSAETVVEHVIAQLRGTLAELAPPDVTTGRVGYVLRDLARRVAPERGWAVHFDESGDRIAGPPAEVIFAIGREAITNAAKHSGASNLSIEVGMLDDEAVLTVDDDGTGFLSDPRIDPLHLGLVTMRERAAEAGGVCIVSSRTGGGTRVRVRIPLGVQTPTSIASGGF